MIRVGESITQTRSAQPEQPEKIDSGLGTMLKRFFMLFGVKQKSKGCGCARRERWLNSAGKKVLTLILLTATKCRRMLLTAAPSDNG